MNDSPAPPVTPTGGATPGPQQSTSLWREHLPFVFLLGVWFAVNLLTIDRYPCASGDEVTFADPAINLLLTGHYTGSAWSNQSSTAFWTVNVPLYPALLYLWLHLTGYSIAGVRSLNIVLIAAAAIVLYRTMNKMCREGRRGAGRLIALLLLLGYSLIFDYRGGRIDCVCILLFSLAFMAVVCFPPRARLLAVSVCAFLMPWSGLQCLPTLAILGCFLLFLDRRSYSGVFLFAGLGSICGLASLLSFFKYEGALGDFFKQLHDPGAGGSMVRSLFQNTFTHHNRLPKDFSFCVLFAGAVLSQIIGWRSRSDRWRSPLMSGLMLCIAISSALLLLGKFPTYYSWMVYIPLSVAVVCQYESRKVLALERKILGVTCGLAMFIGAGLHACAAAYDWPYRDPAIPDNLVARNVRPGDVAYGDTAIYYALRNNGLKPQVGIYLMAMQPWEKEKVSIVFDKPEHFSVTAQALGGEWKQVDEYKPPRMGFMGTSWDMGFLSAYNYYLAVYRRVSTNAPGQAAH